MTDQQLLSKRRPAAAARTLAPYAAVLAVVLGLAVLSYSAGDAIVARLGTLEDMPIAPELASIVLFGLCSFVSFYITRNTAIPSFVMAIALGMAGRQLFVPIISNPTIVSSLVTTSAAVLLFGGGLEMPLRDFIRLFPKISLLALPGVVISGFLLSATIGALSGVLGFAIAPAVIILLGAILASTDPAAIIPVLEDVRFKRPDAKELVIGESALNDVVGTLLTSAFLKLSLATATLLTAYAALASRHTAIFLLQQVLFGIVFGVLGFGLLTLLSRMKRSQKGLTYGADQVYFLAIPILAFVASSVFGGSGFLAAFVAGLLFKAEDYMQDIRHFFSQTIDGVAKPIVFLLVGALVDPRTLLDFAPIGVLAALVYMFVIRPFMVFLVLGPFAWRKDQNGLSTGELLFISFVRETGAIPAVLLVTTVERIGEPAGLVEIGMWIILLTLVVAPPLTPFVARRLGVAD
jgi:NhaP-type Na+/H+ or K+/H+ antiporter